MKYTPTDADGALALDREKRLFALCGNLRVAEVQDKSGTPAVGRLLSTATHGKY